MAALEVISDTSNKEPFQVYVNGILQEASSKQNVYIQGMPLEVYQLKVAFDGGHTLQTMAFLQLGKIRNFLVSEVQGQHFLTEGPISREVHPVITDTVFYQIVNAEKIKELEEPLAQSSFDDAPADTTVYLPKKEEKVKEEPVISPAQQQALERLTYKPIMGETSGPDCFLTLLNEDLDQIKVRLLDEPSPAQKLNFATTVLNNKCLTIDQLKVLMRTVEGDDFKLDLYSRVRKQLVDPENRSDLAILLETEEAHKAFVQMP